MIWEDMDYEKNKKISCFICFGSVCIMLIFGLRVTSKSKSVSAEDSVIPISRIQGSFAINVHDQRELVAFADHVFVGKVLKNEGYEYIYSSPYTNYTVQVLENIKGNLIMDKGIPIVKQGGLSKDGSYYEMFEDDELPAEKGIYIFYAYVQKDGSLLATGPNSGIKIDIPADGSSSEAPGGTNQNEEFGVESNSEIPEGTNQNEKFAAVNEKEEFFRNTDIYKEAVDAANHQDDVEVMEVERYTSIYEADSQ